MLKVYTRLEKHICKIDGSEVHDLLLSAEEEAELGLLLHSVGKLNEVTKQL